MRFSFLFFFRRSCDEERSRSKRRRLTWHEESPEDKCCAIRRKQKKKGSQMSKTDRRTDDHDISSLSFILSFFFPCFDKTRRRRGIYPVTQSQYAKSVKMGLSSTGLRFGFCLRLGRRVLMIRLAESRRPRSMNAAALNEKKKKLIIMKTRPQPQLQGAKVASRVVSSRIRQSGCHLSAPNSPAPSHSLRRARRLSFMYIFGKGREGGRR